MSGQQSDTNGVPQKDPLPSDEEVEYRPGGSKEPNPDPKEPGGDAATRHPPAE